jgi:hypothetical protein
MGCGLAIDCGSRACPGRELSYQHLGLLPLAQDSLVGLEQLLVVGDLFGVHGISQ